MNRSSRIEILQHPLDEQELCEHVQSEGGHLIWGSNSWPTSEPRVIQTAAEVKDFSAILFWYPLEAPGFRATERQGTRDWNVLPELWHALVLQRSRLKDEHTMRYGSVGFSTWERSGTELNPEICTSVERRFERLRRWTKKHYRNSVLGSEKQRSQWGYEYRIAREDTYGPAPWLWVGPHAMEWLQSDLRNACIG